jgi:bifunctional oligoribonuclease and PAP phosphatase NrnA
MNPHEIAQNIIKRIEASDNILIIASTPVDADSFASALSLKWWIKEKYNKDARSYVFASYPDLIKDFPSYKDVESKYPNNIDFSVYDLIITVDGNNWTQMFTRDWEPYVNEQLLEKVVNIDHHPSYNIQEMIPDYCLRVLDSCTVKVLYDYIIKPSNVEITLEVADWMYKALLYDTNRFEYQIYETTYLFAQDLFNKGVDHTKHTNIIVTKESFDFLAWAIENTEYFPELKTSILVIDQDKFNTLQEKFGEGWYYKKLFKYYQIVYMRNVEGVNYSLMFAFLPKTNTVDIAWRTRSYNSPVEIQKVLTQSGFNAGGHRDAGGGTSNYTISETKDRFLREMKKAIS